ncbi:DNA helicase, UvrD/REP type [Ophiocordyceps camponoti-floridani]|uniref:DNA 3'-5' helicase n=1 Tax=Ophiocordyceps camponoti-floridani TaxID=2030778 RepID=A0A8H4VH80_9HYPO|nr:DNA helicase, UvrD/REP type [Ophiocordyceps camponoti-floridani]
MSTAILQSLNKAQQRAVTSNASTVAILAGPGSGKTHTLTARVVWLVQQEGYKPCDIIIATFTVKAAKEMRTRIADALGQKLESTLILGTFHSIARRYLAKYGRLIGLDSKFGIADDGDSRAIIQRICKRLNLGVEPPQAKAWISKRKSNGAPSQSSKQNPATPALLTCFEEYQSHLAKANLLDYDDLLVRCVDLLQKHPSCVFNIQAVLIDEYQDTNGIQYELMKLFAQERQRITIVGDPDQSIYGWRSADIRNLQRLLQDFLGTEEVALEENYRSSQLILSLALNVIQQDKTRYQKRLVPVHSKGLKPVLRKIKSSIAEGEWIVTEIRRIMMLCGKMLAHEDVAILLRSASLSRHIESALGKAGIAYRMVGGTKFYDRKEIKALLDYLRVIHQADCNDALARIINVPRRGIGEATIKSLLNEAEQANMSLWSLLRRHCRGGRRTKTNIRPKMEQNLAAGLQLIQGLRDKAAQANGTDTLALARLIEHLVDQLRFRDYLKEEYAEDHENRWANVQELVNMARDATRNLEALDEEALPEIEGVEQAQDNDVLGRFLANVALASDAQKDDGGGDKKSLVTISTIHAAKGLEWPVVFIPSVYAGSIPHSRSEDSDEERRLLYVAMTRAKASLYLSWPLYGPQGTGSKTELSPFVSPFAAMFAAKGPSLDKCVVRGMAQLLGREMPKDKAIFDQLPVMFSMEDDVFPVDEGHRDDTDRRAPKRPRTDCSGEKTKGPWKPDYVTTMDEASKFTMSSLPGFVSAGAHHTAAMAAPRPREQKRGGPMSSNGRRRPDQRSLLGFVTETKATSSFISTAIISTAPAEAAPPRREAIIDAALAHHKLSNTKLPAPPGASERLGGGTINDGSPEPDADKALDVGEGKQPLRPASSFHATTFASAMQQTGVRRPAGLGPRPSLDRVRKPFKPLTIERLQRGGGRGL